MKERRGRKKREKKVEKKEEEGEDTFSPVCIFAKSG
jgi:hypothetical protein